ncbi:N-acetylmuramoyl-L-alanine amidase family protein [Clostridium sp. UBA1652]|uniref:N-acetylmuramoyl-L-alanine amidase family protein n=1 Tax=Clostridium sp. UBA1652 TaxID=1946348 RepID=UPI0025795C79|nr:N-acetylmuramoyl-L-alanine amidase [Clostridium sp. UBA1652]
MRKVILGMLSIFIIFALNGCSNKVEKDAVEETVNSNISEEQLEEEVSKEDSENISQEANPEAKEEKNEAKVTVQKVVVVDPGHSSNGNREQERNSPDSDLMKIKDPGGAQGVVSRTPEYVVAMSVSLKLKAKLEQNGIKVIMTKTQDGESPGNIDRAEVGNKNNADLAIRIHCDSADSKSAKGASMLVPAPVGYAKDVSEVSKKYGQIILNDLIATVGMNNRGTVERSDLTGFNWSKVPVVLVEMGFMSNPEEDTLLNSEEYQNKLVEGLSKGILNALK